MAGVYFSWGNIKTKEFQLFRPKYMFYDKRGLTPFVIKFLHIQFYDEKLKKDCTGRYFISFIAHNRCNLKNKKMHAGR